MLIGRALRAAVVPIWLPSRAFGDPPAEGFRSRPRLARVVADMLDLGAARPATQDDFWTIGD